LRLQGDRQKARDYYNEALQQTLAINYRTRAAATLLRLGETYYVEGDFQTALDYFNRAFTISRELGNQGEAYTLYSLGTVYAAFGDRQKALDYFNRALPLWRYNNNGRVILSNRSEGSLLQWANGEKH